MIVEEILRNNFNETLPKLRAKYKQNDNLSIEIINNFFFFFFYK